MYMRSQSMGISLSQGSQKYVRTSGEHTGVSDSRANYLSNRMCRASGEELGMTPTMRGRDTGTRAAFEAEYRRWRRQHKIE